MMRRKLMSAICLFIPCMAFATPTPSPIIWNNITFNAYSEGSYNYLLRKNNFTSGRYDRTFDLQQNGYTYQQGGMTAAMQPEQGFGFILNPVFGRDASQLAMYGWNPYFGSQTLQMVPEEVVGQYAIHHFVFMVGNFVSLAGYEFYDPTQDSNFSRSILAQYEPNTHLGVRSIYTPNDNIKFTAGINNGWDSIRDTSRQKTIELGLDYKINPMYTLESSLYSGEERVIPYTSTGPTGQRTILNIIGKLFATPQLTFLTNIDFVLQTNAALPNDTLGQAIWEGITGYVDYAFTEKWYTSFRAETFYDKNGYVSGVRQSWREATISLGYTPFKHLQLIAETRHDFSNVASFVDVSGTGTSNNQQSYALAAILLL